MLDRSLRNCSHDPATTASIIQGVWAHATNKQKNEVAELAGLSSVKALYYTRKTGLLTEATAKAFSQVFNLPLDYLLCHKRPLISVDLISLADEIIPTNEESLKQYNLLMQVAEVTKDSEKLEIINKIKVAVQKLL
ncbi:MAG: hypothetical protein K0S75_364 [Clostridia bacterium]|jgi:transcriptional regulator with XRE-family HTH domain|nr:hypothetical protein [Clostridia bacterium]